MRLRYDESVEAFRAELLEWLAANRPTPEEMAADPSLSTGHAPAWARRWTRTMFDAGWLVPGWPPERGGRNAGPIETLVFIEELAKAKVPRTTNVQGLGIVAPSILDYGSEDQIRDYAMPILRGEKTACLGMSEPGAGSDLAGLSTRAVRDGEEYVINGQKVYTTGAHVATHLWLAARTGAPDSRHRGISLFVIPMGTPGITVRPLMTQGDERTNEVFLDDVRVPAESRVGEENDGWRIITLQRNFERLFSHNEARYELGELVEWAWDSEAFDTSETTRLAVAELAADVEIARLFSMRSASVIDAGQVPVAEASINKVWYSELRQRICATALDLIGEAGQIGHGDEGAPGGGFLERGYRASTVVKFGGGTNEVQRNIIAQAALGMPR